MSDPVLVATIAAVASTLSVVVSTVGVVVSVRSSAKNTRQFDGVHEAVNGGWAKMRLELNDARTELETLKKTLLPSEIHRPLWTTDSKGPTS